MLTINLVVQSVHRDGAEIPLPPMLFKTLAALRGGTFVQTPDVYAEVWGDELKRFNLVRWNMKRLRDTGFDIEGRKLYGFRLNEPVQIMAEPHPNRSPDCPGHVLCEGVLIYCARMTS